MKIKQLILSALLASPWALFAQFAPEAGMPGTTAIHADSSVFVAWATQCMVERGWQQVGNPSLGYASYGVGIDGIGKADNMVVSLGDGGSAVLTFQSPICNGEGPDFAVFENGFHSEPHVFLELAFVEVSSNGVDFFRFPAVSNVPFDAQTDSFATTDATLIHNFAGKYEVFYGTPFDLDDLEDSPLLDKNCITHVRLVDVVGNIDPDYATYDSQGYPVNDPWPTPFASSGFDLDAVGVIHDREHYAVAEMSAEWTLYPNPVSDVLHLGLDGPALVEVCNLAGQRLASSFVQTDGTLDFASYQTGIYIVRIVMNHKTEIHKIVKQ